MTTLWNDVNYAIRVLRKSPGYIAVAVLTLGLGVGANTAVFSIINTLLFRPPVAERPQELVQLYQTSQNSDIRMLQEYEPWNYADYTDVRDENQVFSDVMLYNVHEFRLGDDGPGEQVMSNMVTGNYFRTLGTRAKLGRLITPEDDKPGAPPVVVISERLWKRLGSDPKLVGGTLRLNRNSYTVIGVTPEAFLGTMIAVAPDIWVPITVLSEVTKAPQMLTSRTGRSQWVIGRLKPGITREQAQASLQPVAAAWHARFPDTHKGRGINATPVTLLPAMVRSNVAAVSVVLLALVSLVLLIACVNLANLALARADSRRREVSIRLALGASRWRIARQLLSESLLVSVLGGMAGLALAAWAAGALNGTIRFLPVPVYIDLATDGRVVAFALGISLLASILFGLWPAWKATRQDLGPALKDGSAGAGATRSRVRKGLVVAQVAASMVLLVTAGLCLRSLGNAEQIDMGFDPNPSLTASIEIPARTFPPEDTEAFYRQAMDRLASLPGVAKVGSISHLPLRMEIRTTQLRVEGQPPVEDDLLPSFDTASAGPGYFSAMNIPVVQGREFQITDDVKSPRVALVNQAFARKYFPNGSAVGKRLQTEIRGKWESIEIVGVAQDGKYRTLGEETRPFFWEAALQHPANLGRTTLIVRARNGRPADLAAAARRELTAINAAVPVNLRTLNEAMELALLPARALAAVLGLFGVLGLTLAAVGIYGVVTYLVGRRTREIGLRMALGARPGDVLSMVLRQGAVLAVTGAVIGMALAIGAAQLIAEMLYGVKPWDPVTLGGVGLLLVGVALAANLVPARRAMRVDPLVALREE
ncbi:MAG: ABC transporter permease [Bryobacteraceae bacterium]|nr:ABC transporter permease [Bryobacteraceae bacterium]